MWGMDPASASPEQRLYDAAVRWAPEPGRTGPRGVIWAAADALAEGVDSPSLRDLAGASPADPTEEIRPLVEASLDELGIPRPGALPPWRRIAAGGRVFSRLPADTVRFAVAEAPPEAGGFQLQVYVNEVEMTARGAGIGMEPIPLLVQAGGLDATTATHAVQIARCRCGISGCGFSLVDIVRDGGTVHWEWSEEVPMSHGVSFPAEAYDAELRRIRADRSWERPEDTTVRLVLDAVDHDALAGVGYRVSWAAVDASLSTLFTVALADGDIDARTADYQVFLRVPRHDRAPAEVAAEVARALRRPPREWVVTYRPISPRNPAPPPMAGPGWRWEE